MRYSADIEGGAVLYSDPCKYVPRAVCPTHTVLTRGASIAPFRISDQLDGAVIYFSEESNTLSPMGVPQEKPVCHPPDTTPTARAIPAHRRDSHESANESSGPRVFG